MAPPHPCTVVFLLPPRADDYVKVKVRLGPALEHYYILSRFLLSRMLTVIALPQHKARAQGGAGAGRGRL